MSGLPLPTTATPQHRKVQGLYNLAKSKRGVALLLILSLTSLFYIFDAGPLIQNRISSYGHPNAPDWPQLDGLDVSGTDEQSTTPLSSLGLEADRSFHLGSTSKAAYKAELEEFIQRAFPKWLRERAHASLELYLGDAATVLTLPEIPHKIYQTAKTDPRWDWRSSTWRNVPGYTHWFFNDESADKWVRDVFGGTEIEKVWDIFGPGIKWTFAAAPLHPILIDTIRRVHHVTAVAEANKAKNKTSDATDSKEHWVGGELLRDDGTVSIMEWTGPGVFTDSVIRYLAAEHNITWPALKNLRKPLRIRDAVVLPVTGFSPGVGMFGAGETTNEEAMVQHLFAGSWKTGSHNERRW
ncbi:membrane-bound alpha-1,6- mannosyltransferase Initiation-specific [Ceratobasidium sp. 423]|nr:membrane-bound alpha-1,6- mannosyltransferase Initiation-specific [Ceratobasidium sp. 423]